LAQVRAPSGLRRLAGLHRLPRPRREIKSKLKKQPLKATVLSLNAKNKAKNSINTIHHVFVGVRLASPARREIKSKLKTHKQNLQRQCNSSSFS
jgi:hypothetical protein